MKKAVVVLFLFLSLFTCFSCDPVAEKTIIGITPEEGAFSTMYAVDSVLDIQGKNYLIRYSDGSTKTMPLSEEMIDGFDTRTTGQKQMYLTAGKFVSEAIVYTVYDPSDASRQIETATRLTVEATSDGSAMVYTVGIVSCDLSALYAFSCTWEGTDTFSEDLSEITLQPKAPMQSGAKIRKSSKKLRILVYTDVADEIPTTLFTLRISKGSDREIKITDITVSDGNKDYYLPDIG